MPRRTMVAGAALALALLVGGGGTTMAEDTHECAAGPNGFGQHTSEMAREHGGIAAATAHHNQTTGTNLTVGEHQQMMREMCGTWA